MENIQDYRDRVVKAEREAREAKAWLQFIMKNPEVVNCEASRLAAERYFNGDEMTPDSLSEAMQSPQFREMLAMRALPTDEEIRAAAIEKIPGAKDSPVTKWQTTGALANKAAEIAERRELSGKSTDELRQIIKDGRPAPVEPELGPEWTRKTILALPAKELRKLIDKYGTPAVNRRLAGSI